MNKIRPRHRAVIRRCLILAAGCVLDEVEAMLEEENNRKKRIWVREWIKRRDVHGASANLIKELATEDPEEYKKCLRMTTENFETLLNLVAPRIKKMDTILRDAIPPHIKLQITLHFLATGTNYRTLQHFFRVSKSAISKLIPEVCDAIYEALQEYIRMPTGEDEWKVIAKGFDELWNFPGCCGAIDGKHILIKAPTSCGSQFFNYKGTSSVVLMALVDHNYCFTYVCIGSPGSASDGGIFQQCNLGQQLCNGLIPPGYYVVGDDAFPLQHYLMKPYSHYRRPLTIPEKVFNYRLSRARRIVENAFGILVSRFRVFDSRIDCRLLKTVNKIVLASCALHNFLRKSAPSTYFPHGCVDEEDTSIGSLQPGRWRTQITELRNLERFRERRATNLANQTRDKLKNYFCTDGAVPWQYRHIY